MLSNCAVARGILITNTKRKAKKKIKTWFEFLFRGFILIYKLRWRNAHVLFELPTKEINIGKITKLRDLRNGIAFKPKKVTSMVDLELNDVFLRGDTVYFLKQLLKI